MKVVDSQILQETLLIEAGLIILLFGHLVFFFRRYRTLATLALMILIGGGAVFAQYSDWNYSFSAPIIKRRVFLGLWITLAALPYLNWMLKKAFRPKHVKIFLSHKGPLDEIAIACEALSQSKVGGLIAIRKSDSLARFIQQGLSIDSKVKRELLVSLFAPNTPTHDGAVLIEGDRIAACSTVLPLTKNVQNDLNLGTRHMAALGFSEETDALVIVISEETGRISLAMKGRLFYDVPHKNLKNQIRKLLL